MADVLPSREVCFTSPSLYGLKSRSPATAASAFIAAVVPATMPRTQLARQFSMTIGAGKQPWEEKRLHHKPQYPLDKHPGSIQKCKRHGHNKDCSPKCKRHGHNKDCCPICKRHGHNRDCSPKCKRYGHNEDCCPICKRYGHNKDFSPKITF